MKINLKMRFSYNNNQFGGIKAAVISLTVEIQFESQVQLELDEWIRYANPSFTELLDYHF